MFARQAKPWLTIDHARLAFAEGSRPLARMLPLPHCVLSVLSLPRALRGAVGASDSAWLASR